MFYVNPNSILLFLTPFYSHQTGFAGTSRTVFAMLLSIEGEQRPLRKIGFVA
jgi:hypothetical protein